MCWKSWKKTWIVLNIELDNPQTNTTFTSLLKLLEIVAFKIVQQTNLRMRFLRVIFWRFSVLRCNHFNRYFNRCVSPPASWCRWPSRGPARHWGRWSAPGTLSRWCPTWWRIASSCTRRPRPSAPTMSARSPRPRAEGSASREPVCRGCPPQIWLKGQIKRSSSHHWTFFLSNKSKPPK